MDIAFVSMPFGDDPDSPDNEWTKLYEYGLKPLESKIEGIPETVKHEPIRLWRADKDLASLMLKTNVMRGIEQATFMICVLTTSVIEGKSGLRLTNPNVLWELGYAESLGKPIIVMADDPSLSQLPILTGTPNVLVYNHKMVESVKPKDAEHVLKVIARDLVPYISVARQESRMGNKGLDRTRPIAYSNRDAIDLKSLIRDAREQVDILTTNVNYFLFDKLHGDPSPFESALGNKATVRIVTMDPESVIAEYRARQLIRGQDVPEYRKELRDGILYFYHKYGSSNSFHLHIYNDLPLQIMFRVDSSIITSIVTRGERARKRIQVRFSLYDEGVTESFVGHFQSMFDNSLDVRAVKWVLGSSPPEKDIGMNPQRRTRPHR